MINWHKKTSFGVAETLFVCPMHPNIVRNKPGFCPLCGMPLVIKKTEAEHHHSTVDRHEGHHAHDFINKFWTVFIATIPIVLYSEIFAHLSAWQPPHFASEQYAMLALGSFVYFYGGSVFLVGAYRELRVLLPGMMTLIALAITSAYAFSVYSVLVGSSHTLFWELSTLIAIMLLGHWVEMKTVQVSQGALNEFAKILPDTALAVRGGIRATIPTSMLAVGDQVFALPGEKIPADGIVIDGQSEVDESIITGESKLVLKKNGDEVIAGSLNGDGALTIKVQKIGDNTFLAGVMRLIADAEISKSRMQVLSDRAALYLTLVAVIAGATTFVAWYSTGAGIVTSIERLVAVLVIACPHALGLAVPLVASISTTIAARNGFLVRQRIALESARTIDVILFDKTGTLTKGVFGISAIIPATFFNEADVLMKAASLNNDSEHPLARAMILEAKKRNMTLATVRNFERVAGKGARGDTDGGTVITGNAALMNENAILISEDILSKTQTLEREGKTVVYVASSGSLLGLIALADIIRDESREAIQTLHRMGIRTAMVTGDAPDVAAWVARELGIDEYFARVLPAEKSEKVKMLQAQGHKVAMVGDGVNDAPALMQSDLGVAIGAGMNVAVESAGIILVKNDPRDIVKIIRLSQLTRTKMIQNLYWATGYNIIALPLAAGALASQGIILEPAVAAVFMSASTVIVALNALLFKPRNLSN